MSTLFISSQIISILLFFIFILLNPLKIHCDNNNLFSSNGWMKADLHQYPPKNDMSSYLFVKGSHDKPKGLSIDFEAPENLNWKNLQSIKIELQYWGHGGRPVNEDAKGTTLFRIAVVTCDQDKPTTKWASFEGSEYHLDKWNNLTFETPHFNITCYQRISIMVLSSPVWIKNEGNYLAAIRNIAIDYTFQDLLEESKNDAKQLAFQCISPSNCDRFNIKPEKSWSNTGFPVLTSEIQLIRFPDNDPDEEYVLQIKSIEMDTNVCIKICFWITDGAILSLYINKRSFQLSPTYTLDSSSPILYQWYHANICLAHFYRQLNIANVEISILSKKKFIKENDEFAAIADITSEDIRSYPYKLSNDLPDLLNHWSKPQAHDEWYFFPEESWFWRDADNPPLIGTSSLLVLKIHKQSIGTAYLYSKWFKYSVDHILRYTINWEDPTGEASIEIGLFDENFNPLPVDEVFIQGNSSTSASYEFVPFKAIVNRVYRIQVRVDWKHNGLAKSEMIFSDIDLSDACRNGNATCNNQGYCVNIGTNQFKCICDETHFGVNCEQTDWCIINGHTFCKERGGQCDREVFAFPNHEVCSCGPNRYWKITSSGGSCVDLDPCSGLNAFCDEKHVCKSNPFREIEPCQDCDLTNEYNKVDSKCVKMNICDDFCANLGCTIFMGRPFCHHHTIQQPTVSGECDLRSKIIANCDQICKKNGANISCDCYDEYLLDPDQHSCIGKQSCTLKCPPNSKCVIKSQSTAECECNLGFLKRDNKCVSICDLADQLDSQAKELVGNVCGHEQCKMIDNQIKCKCKSPYMMADNGLCNLDRICLKGHVGQSFCSKFNAICVPQLVDDDKTGQKFKCVCPAASKMDDNGKCIAQCDKHFDEICKSKNAICKPDLQSNKPKCECLPGFKRIVNEESFYDYCYLMDHAMEISVIMRINRKLVFAGIRDELLKLIEKFVGLRTMYNLCEHDYNRTQCMEYMVSVWQSIHDRQFEILRERAIESLIVQHLNSLQTLYGRKFEQIFLSKFESLKNSVELSGENFIVKAIVELPTSTAMEIYLFHSKTASQLTGQISLLDLKSMCNNFSAESPAVGYCLLGSETVLLSNNYEEKILMPCDYPLISQCPENTICETFPNTSAFSCECLPGFREIQRIHLKSNKDDVFVRETCEDIDECISDGVCSNNSVCINFVGSHACECKPGFILDQLDNCLGLCEHLNCMDGTCTVINETFASCQCNEGAFGVRCEFHVHGTRKELYMILLIMLAVIVFGFIIFCCSSLLRRHTHASTIKLNNPTRSVSTISNDANIQLSDVKPSPNRNA